MSENKTAEEKKKQEQAAYYTFDRVQCVIRDLFSSLVHSQSKTIIFNDDLCPKKYAFRGAFLIVY